MDYKKKVFDNLKKKRGVTVKFECLPENAKYYYVDSDFNNGLRYFAFFNTKKQAVDYFMRIFNVNRTIEDYNIDERGYIEPKSDLVKGGFIEEKDGKLYYHGIRYTHYDTDLLFNPKQYVNPPKTIEELRTYIEDGHVLHFGGRGPADYLVNNVLYAGEYVNCDGFEQICYEPLKTSSSYEKFFDETLRETLHHHVESEKDMAFRSVAIRL
jgi:hypothetical protein